MPWKPVNASHFITFSALVGIILIAELRSPPGWVPLLDGANLLFHEAGHPIFGIFGETMGLYGGTLGQLAFPLVVIVEFWRQRATLSFAVGGLWLFENFFNIARYAADARAQQLPLVGGGEHDWWNILSRWGMLEHDIGIALTLTCIGALGIALTWVWLGWRCL